MDPYLNWTFSGRLSEVDKELLSLELQGLEEWNPTQDRDGIEKEFVFQSVGDAMDFHTLVSAASKLNNHHSKITIECKKVSVVWITYEPKPNGVSYDDVKMARLCDTIARVVLDNEAGLNELEKHGWERNNDIPNGLFYFKNHSKVSDFARAITVGAKHEVENGSLSIATTYSSVAIQNRGEARSGVNWWLRFVTEKVVKPDDRDKVRTCGDNTR